MNERLDHTNYEAWLLDRLEGNLSPEQERELAAWLVLHPELDPAEGPLPTIADAAAELRAADKESLKRVLPPTANVDPRNVEDHLIARLENDLSAEHLEALRLFLLKHPEHQQAARLYALTKVVPASMAFPGKPALERALPPLGLPTKHTLDDHLVARLEGDLSAQQEEALAAFIAADADAQRRWKLMQATRVHAQGIVHPDKASLKKGGRVIAINTSRSTVRWAAAASIALLLGVAFWWLANPSTQGTQIADGGNPVLPVLNSESKDSLAPRATQDRPGPLKEGPLDVAVEDPQHGTVERDNEQGGSTQAPLPREEPLPLAQQRNPTPNEGPQAPTPHDAQVPEVPLYAEEAPAANSATTAQQDAPNTVGQTLAATLRERVLDQPAGNARPLDTDDAVAAVDKGLKAVAGQRAGLAVQRDADGRGRGFNLRLGRNLGISASR